MTDYEFDGIDEVLEFPDESVRIIYGFPQTHDDYLPLDPKVVIAKSPFIEDGFQNYYIKKFESLNLSTMTVVCPLRGRIINLSCLSYLLPVYILSDGEQYSDLPPGILTSIRSLDYVKGERGNTFKNAVLIKVTSGSEKRHTVEISPKNSHMCGAKSIEMGKQVSSYVVSHILELCYFIEKVQENNYLFEKTVRFIEEDSQVQIVNGGIRQILIWRDPNSVSEDIRFFYTQLRKRSTELIELPTFITRCCYIRSLDKICTTDLQVDQVLKCMVNYNYRLGFEINRKIFSQIMWELDYDVIFNNVTQARVKIKVECLPDPSDSESILRRKGRTWQTFTFNKSGAIMQSGPSNEKMELPYYNVMCDIIRCIKQIKM